MSCAGCGGDMWRTRTSAPEGIARCRACRGGHGSATEYKKGCRCEACRAGHNERVKAYGAKRMAAGKPLHLSKKRVSAVCDGCGVEFQARIDHRAAGKGRFCSHACHNAQQLDPSSRRAAAKERTKLHGAPGTVRHRALKRARAALELGGGRRVFVQGACAVCGASFVAARADARYCSVRCAKKNKRGSFGVSFLDRMYLYSRDRWTCHLCGLAVEPCADELSAGAATLDHVVPQAAGGGHEFENLRLCHRICNSIRRDIPLAEFLTDDAVEDLRTRVWEAVHVSV